MYLHIFQVLGPLLRLRQACSHPQAVRGQFITATRATMSMEELLESLIKKTQSESEEALRQYIAALNGKIAFAFFCQVIFIIIDTHI
jgi:E3 ubiquitin-protein ligase SHPRH